MKHPIEGLEVIDLSTGIAGPYATKMFADAGAKVWKIEPPNGDPLRRWKASAQLGQSEPLPASEDGALFRFLNTSKQGAVLDLDLDEDREVLLRLASRADLVVESFEPGELDARGLGYQALAQSNPGISLLSVTPFGQDGPWSKRPANEFTLQAEAGSTAFRGYLDRPPVAAGGRIGEYVAGTFGAVSALSAVLWSRQTGLGRHVDTSTFEAMLISFQTFQYIHAQLEPGVPLARNVEVPSVEPAADGWVGFSLITGQQWKDFSLMIEQPEMGEDENLLAAHLRFEQMDRILEAVHAWTREHSVEEVLEKAEMMRVPVAPVGNGSTLLKTDHFRARKVFTENPAGFSQPRVPYRLGVGEPRAFEPAPRLGQHTHEARKQASGIDSAPTASSNPLPAASGTPKPLEGIFVADFSAFWAGPVATSYLAALGADVVKIESIQRPDGMRFAGGITPKPGQTLWEMSPVFHGANIGKRGITLDLESEAGLKLAKRLVEKADIVVENFSPRVIERFGLGWETVHDLNPETIMLRMPAFGLDGPWRDRVGFAMTIEQATGLAWTTGFPDRSPLVPRGSCDPLGGMTAVFATLAALEVRRSGGGGQLVEIPLVEVGLNAAAEQLAEWTAYQQLLERAANRGPGAAPQGIYTCAEGEHLAVSIENDKQWESLVQLLGQPEWSQDEALAHAAGRRAAHDRLDRELELWFAETRAADTVEQLVAEGIPAGLLRNARELRPHPHLEERGFFVTREHPIVGELGYPCFPARFSGQYLPIPGPAHTLGQHNEEVLSELLELSREEIDGLRNDKVIGERPSFM
ncbi:CoA transferase [Myxococcota bacterium]|nr:CoA transferase [Myxococcota bacterium]